MRSRINSREGGGDCSTMYVMSALSNFGMLTMLGWTAFDAEDSKTRDQVAAAVISVSFKLLNETEIVLDMKPTN